MWDKACCAPTQKGEATTCVRQSPMRWMCELESMVNTKAFAKSVRKVKLLTAPPLQRPAFPEPSCRKLHTEASKHPAASDLLVGRQE